MKKRFVLLLTLGLLMTSVVSVGAATTYISCGQTGNTRYSTIWAADWGGEQSSRGTWRNTGYTVVYVEDGASGNKTTKTCSKSNDLVDVWNKYAAKTRKHYHYGTDHQAD